MSIENSQNNRKTPWHVWIVGIVALLWNSIGALDYVMTQTKNEDYMSNFTAEQLSFFYGLPEWIIFAWAIAVWGSVIGTVLLLLRNRVAVWIYLASLLAMMVTAIHNYGFSNGFEVIGDTFSLVFTGVIFVIALALYLYSRAMFKSGVLN